MVYNSFELPESLFSFLWMFHLMLIWPASNISTFYRYNWFIRDSFSNYLRFRNMPKLVNSTVKVVCDIMI
ncbi:BnaA08g02010D [Brassica napus]|uniref:BnaA08g02010D protein n=1 Tax=Brassica napus TaxID=3708 RepID=A0A078I918_BRANA|nr:BnaA08g02010D [Brassica napus]